MLFYIVWRLVAHGVDPRNDVKAIRGKLTCNLISSTGRAKVATELRRRYMSRLYINERTNIEHLYIHRYTCIHIYIHIYIYITVRE